MVTLVKKNSTKDEICREEQHEWQTRKSENLKRNVCKGEAPKAFAKICFPARATLSRREQQRSGEE